MTGHCLTLQTSPSPAQGSLSGPRPITPLRGAGRLEPRSIRFLHSRRFLAILCLPIECFLRYIVFSIAMNQFQLAFAQTMGQWNVDAENGNLQPFRDKAQGTRRSPINWYVKYWQDWLLYAGEGGGEIDPLWIQTDTTPPTYMTAGYGGGTTNLVLDLATPDLFPGEEWGYAISFGPPDAPYYRYGLFTPPETGISWGPLDYLPDYVTVRYSILRSRYLRSRTIQVDVPTLP